MAEISRHVVTTLDFGLKIAFSFGLLGAAEFAYLGRWDIAVFDASLPVMSAAGWLLLRAGKDDLAAIAVQLYLMAFLAVLTLVFDLPADNVPRTGQNYLLVIALFGYLNYSRKPSLLQLSMIAIDVIAYIILNCLASTYGFSRPMPGAIHVQAAWFNSAISVALMFGGLYAMRTQQRQMDTFARELGTALWQGQLELFYQPQVDSAHRIVGAEALLRWNHPQKGYIGPGEFIPVAERLGLMQKISSWVLVEACKTLASWATLSPMQDLILSINVTADQFHLGEFNRLCMETIQIHGVEPQRLKLELTESVVIADVDTVITRMSDLRASGIAISLDDFGTGYSSLSYLRRLPFTHLKIDKSFVQPAIESDNGAALARAIVKIGLDLKLSVLAEGIETAEQLNFFKSCGCAEFQGYYFGRPMPRKKFESLIFQHPPDLGGAHSPVLTPLPAPPAATPDPAQPSAAQ